MNQIEKSGFLQILEAGFFGMKTKRKYFSILNCGTGHVLTWKNKETDDLETGIFPLGSNVFAMANEEEKTIVLNSSGEILELRAENANDVLKWIEALQNVIPIRIARKAIDSERGSKNHIRAHFSAFIPGKNHQLVKNIEAAESPSIECDVDIYGSPKPFDSPINVQAPQRTKHAYAESLTQQAWMALQTDSFRGSRARMVSTCSSLGDGFMTPLSHASTTNLFDFLPPVPEEIPPCPESPPPYGGGVIEPFQEECDFADEKDEIVDAVSPSFEEKFIAKVSNRPVEVDPKYEGTEFQRKWMQIRKRTAFPS